ncbi:MAG: DEAD/DEAH box helicase [Flavobacteriaceae bacterium]|nr:DEAD/DEAH box helicase [Flavobacteriaceae bacterium]
MSFKSLGLNNALLKAVEKQGYDTPSPIQVKAIPLILEGKDVLASAQTGTGKTAGFTLPMLQILDGTRHPKFRPIRALVLTPTRELAAQVHDNVREYGAFLNMKSTVVFGGVKAKAQIATIKQGVDVLVATPGRLLDLENQGALSLRRVEILVLDEADRMLDMGFLRDIKKIMSMMPSKRQNLLFSATFSREIKQLAAGILKNPVLVEAEPENSTAEKVTQKVYRVDKGKKTELVTKLISEGNWRQVLMFTRTKHGANKLTKKLIDSKISAAAIHGNKSQGARTKALAGFKNNDIRVLVATDIAARGLDIPLLPHVINFELPNIPEDYVHRIGRTGRAGAKGEAISLVCIEEMEYVREIEKLLKQKLETEVIEGFEPKNNDEPGKSNSKKPQRKNHTPKKRNPGENKASRSRNDSRSSRRKDNRSSRRSN